MFSYNGKEYELKFTLERIELVENYLKMPTVADIVQTNGAFSIGAIKTYFGYCLKEAGSDTFVPRKEGAQIAVDLMEKEGYLKVNNMLIEKMSQDLPFLFQGA